ncbi:MAG TPA: glycosyltransferase family 9 protein [Caulobacteraceae bacterium]|nr:glycosyltransferase family 9 protein [Caulobacteraceae bacterium]
MASGLIARLHAEIPHASFTVVTGEAAAGLFRDTPRLDRVIVCEDAAGLKAFKLWNELKARHWGFVLDLRGTGLAGWLRAKKRAVNKPASGGDPVHAVVEAAKLLKLEEDPPAPYLFTGEETEAAAAQFMGRGGPVLAIAPGADWLGKAWPAERFSEVAARLLAPDGPMAGARLLIVGSDADRDAARTVKFAAGKDRVLDATGKLDPLTAYAALRQARLFVGNDGLMAHLAAAAGVPTIALFGPSDDRASAPWGRHVRVVRGPRQFEDFLVLDPNLNQALNHMIDLTMDKVLKAARKLLAETEPQVA